MSQLPQMRPVIRAVSSDEMGAAIGRLLAIALPSTRAAETGASGKVADFLLAWWNGDECGHCRRYADDHGLSGTGIDSLCRRMGLSRPDGRALGAISRLAREPLGRQRTHYARRPRRR